MSLQTLTKEIAIDAKTEAKRIVAEAEQKAKKILEHGEKQRMNILAETEKQAREAAMTEKRETLAAAKLEAKRTIEETKQEKVEELLAKAWKEYIKTREKREYKSMLENLIKQGVKSIGEQAIVKVRQEDLATAKAIAGKAKIKQASILGGAIICSTDEKIIVDNTLEALFEEKSPALKAIAFEKIFGREKK